MKNPTELSKEQKIRYRGHLSLCEIDLAGQQRLAESRVLIVGAGGLGSPVSLYLAAAGVGTIGLLDADTVSLSNLQRQVIHTTADIGRLKVDSAAEKLRAINPHINVATLPLMLDSENAMTIMEDYDLVIDCTDNLPTRLLINDTCVATGKAMVFGAVSRFSGQVFSHKAGTACYRCIFDPSTTDPDADLPCAINGIMNTVVGVIGSLQATEAVKLLVGTGDALLNRILTFDAVTMQFNTFAISPIDTCECQHG
ncbi:HesA/MoeB/ThiF family protein [uncultured Duncaniella sp.]|uniref:HesA/MoeB/ThiF family protein n=1 Tax=uncultured Duncaniella sp. TaxID=2768039 RepID=UPI0025E9962D|nr:HesA/MoeB/ThiF family protein [uncultured Duncaniella sp.]